MLQKNKCCNCSKKAQYNSHSKNTLHFRTALTTWIKHLKFGREEKSFAPLNVVDKVEVWIQENLNITLLKK
ncbi:hypothetical protein GO684_01650 [Wolbachia endosymbiont of Litomosoides brasiliensis]|uniref:hypothetical protein n=1 Tax=Wolbachia endosymbiont of Litomosoides brasiliensis TaxID=1812117 RepID=UPI001589423E|nr:hypothetical protein [Wolbachia endosymbiont of Litomosoides brasiliensis]